MSDAEAVVGTDVPLDLTLSASELDARREHIIRFLRGTVDDAGAAGAVLGLSGGIDSTLTAHLAVEALGTDGLHGLVMPSEVNDDANMSDAERVADDLDISYDVIGIEPVVESFREAFPADLDDAESDAATTAVGNVRVRTRAIFNYFAATSKTGSCSGPATGAKRSRATSRSTAIKLSTAIPLAISTKSRSASSHATSASLTTSWRRPPRQECGSAKPTRRRWA